MGSGRDRNTPCWCGSGRKFKSCHYGRDAQSPMAVSEALAGSKQAHRPRGCLYPGEGTGACLSPVISSHSIQRNGPLDHIAVGGHVLGFPAEFGRLQAAGGRIGASKLGIKKASTFPGFCGPHDRDTFAPIESAPIVPTAHQAFLLSYRALCREFFQKRAQGDVVTNVLESADRGRTLPEQVAFQRWRTLHAQGISLGLRDLEREKKLHDRILLEETWDHDYRYLAIVLDTTPTMVSIGAVIPECDFAGNALATLGQTAVDCDLLGFALLAAGDGGTIIWACRAQSTHGMAFLNQTATLSDAELVQAGARFAFEMVENTFCSPDWWSSLPPSLVKAALDRVNSGLLMDDPGPGRLTDDGVRFVDWRARTRITSLT
jgi:hypothetical protein